MRVGVARESQYKQRAGPGGGGALERRGWDYLGAQVGGKKGPPELVSLPPPSFMIVSIEFRGGVF